ncbi:hypothetical protein GCM10009304_09320 [Pseudomonas matsuisoli]|uniref:Nucleotidyltransferase family protein n=2 Tax=Pseudomonas matsuisoli TaxID=1515666 RepID=A0A917PN50_9PSED|nr:hypothetical protein GCM10009304_09320 [Pseudomonas matsuisoli]
MNRSAGDWRFKRIEMLLRGDPVRLQLLREVAALGLPDCWIGAGFIRSLVWDHSHGYESSSLANDVDVVWFDPKQGVEADRHHEQRLAASAPTVKWSVKNQARMHAGNGDAPYLSTTDAMRYWPETATAIAVRLSADGHLDITAPFGLDDLFALIVRPTPRFENEKRAVYRDRIRRKKWHERWPKVCLRDV